MLFSSVLKWVPIYSSCFWECCNSVLLCTSRNVLCVTLIFNFGWIHPLNKSSKRHSNSMFLVYILFYCPHWEHVLCCGRCWFGTLGNWTPRSFLIWRAVWLHRQEPPNLKITPHSTLTWRYSSLPYQVTLATWPRKAVFIVMVFSWCIFSLWSLCLSPLPTGLKVSRLDMYGEKYKPFKGVKYLTKAGKFQVRTWVMASNNSVCQIRGGGKVTALLSQLPNKS